MNAGRERPPEGTPNGDWAPITLQQRLYADAVQRWGFDPTWQHVALSEVVYSRCEEAVLRVAEEAVFRRYDACRLQIRGLGDGPTPMLAASRSRKPDLICLDERASMTEEDLRAWVASRTTAGFDLETGPPLRLHVLRLPHATNVLAVGHHMVFDGPAMVAVLGYFVACLRAPDAVEYGPGRERSFHEHAVRQHEDLARVDLGPRIAWWKHHLHEAVSDLGIERRPQVVANKDSVSAVLEPRSARSLVTASQRLGYGVFPIAFLAVDVVIRDHFSAAHRVVEVSTDTRRAPFTHTVGHFTDRLFCVQRPNVSFTPDHARSRWRDTIRALGQYVPSLILQERVAVLRARAAQGHGPAAVMFNFVNRPTIANGVPSTTQPFRVLPIPAAPSPVGFDGRMLIWMLAYDTDGGLHCGLVFERESVSRPLAERLVRDVVAALRSAAGW